MRGLKMVVTVILALVLLVSESLFMGTMAVGKAVDEDNIKTAVKETGIISELTDEILSSNTVNMGGKYEDVAKAIVETDAMQNFFAAYLASAIRSQVYGTASEEIANDELTTAFNSSLEEAEAAGDISLSKMEAEYLRVAMVAAIPDLTGDINEVIAKYSTTDSTLADQVSESQSGLQSMMGIGARLIMIIVSLACMAALVALKWRSKMGFLWSAIVTALSSIIYLLMEAIGTKYSVQLLTSSPSEQVVLSLAAKGFAFAAKAGFIVAVALVIAFVVLRIRDRRQAI